MEQSRQLLQRVRDPIDTTAEPCYVPCKVESEVLVFQASETAAVSLSSLLHLLPSLALTVARDQQAIKTPQRLFTVTFQIGDISAVAWACWQTAEDGMLVLPLMAVAYPNIALVDIVVPISNTTVYCNVEKQQLLFTARVIPHNCLHLLLNVPRKEWANVHNIDPNGNADFLLLKHLMLPVTCRNIYLLGAATHQYVAGRLPNTTVEATKDLSSITFERCLMLFTYVNQLTVENFVHVQTPADCVSNLLCLYVATCLPQPSVPDVLSALASFDQDAFESLQVH